MSFNVTLRQTASFRSEIDFGILYPKSKTMTREENREKQLALVEQWKQSGISQAKFTQENNIQILKFRYWVRQHSRQSKKEKSSFIEIGSFPTQEIVLRYPNGVELSLSHRVSVDILKSLIQI